MLSTPCLYNMNRFSPNLSPQLYFQTNGKSEIDYKLLQVLLHDLEVVNVSALTRTFQLNQNIPNDIKLPVASRVDYHPTATQPGSR